MNLKDAGIYDLTNILKGTPTKAHINYKGAITNNIPRLINIPAYQRPYRWTKNYIDRLFQDYLENKAEYFLGSAVFVEKEKNAYLEYDVVDGQQRITTLFLLNYIRFLLNRLYVSEKLSKPNQLNSSEYLKNLKECYVDMIGKSQTPFDNISNKIKSLSEDEKMDKGELVTQLLNCYNSELHIPEEKDTIDETLKERRRCAHKFFDNEQICLKYSRPRYDEVLREALCNVYLKKIPETSNFTLESIESIEKYDEFSQNYINAMKAIFENIWSEANDRVISNSTSWLDKIELAIGFADEIINNLSICVVLTENEGDAYKLFEVLNDRAMSVDDLELIKNHFYKEYCSKSGDSDSTQDKNITKLDEIWADKIFYGNGALITRLISYLAAVYLTGDMDLAFKDDIKYKNAINKKYSSVHYPIGGKKYEFTNICADFNVYYAIKIILDVFVVKAQKLVAVSLQAEKEKKSITYKAFHFLNAMKYHAVLPAITNVIIASYVHQGNSLESPSFDTDFKKYVEGIMNDENHNNGNYKQIHECSP